MVADRVRGNPEVNLPAQDRVLVADLGRELADFEGSLKVRMNAVERTSFVK